MPRGRKKAHTESQLLKALKFIKPIQKATGPPDSQFCYLVGRQAIAFDGVSMLSHPIDQELDIRVHTLEMIAALESLTGTVSITQSDGYLVVRDDSGSKIIYVPTMPMGPIPYKPAWNVESIIGQELIKGLTEVSKVVSNSGSTIRDSAIQLASGTAVATNGELVLQYWHGFTFPEIGYVPKSFIDLLKKIGPEDVQMTCYMGGFTLTIGFLDGSFVGTQMFDLGEEIYPDVSPMVSSPTYTHQILAPGLLLQDSKLPTKDTKISFNIEGNNQFAEISRDTEVIATLACKVLWEGYYNTESYMLVAPYFNLVEPNRTIGAHRITSFMTADYKLRGAILEL